MKGTNDFEKAVEAFLENEKLADPKLSEGMKNEQKTLASCCSYIIKKVRDMKVNALTNTEVFAMAKEYYLSATGKVDKVNCTVVVSDVGSQPAKPKKQKQADVLEGQMSIFDML